MLVLSLALSLVHEEELSYDNPGCPRLYELLIELSISECEVALELSQSYEVEVVLSPEAAVPYGGSHVHPPQLPHEVGRLPRAIVRAALAPLPL